MNSPEFPMKKYSLGRAFVEAIEVTAALVFSRPTAGDAIQRFGEQLEIMHPGPAHKKSYAQIGEYVVRVVDKFGKDDYTIVSANSFNALFSEYVEGHGWKDDGSVFHLVPESEKKSPTEIQRDIRDEVPVVDVKVPAPGDTHDFLTTPASPAPAEGNDAANPGAPVEEKQMSAAEKKELAKQKRLQELGDIGSLETPLGAPDKA